MSVNSPRPFIRWAGGKRALLDEIIPRFTTPIQHYVEPFLGGGAVFLELSRQGLLDVAERVVLSDWNANLVALWLSIQKDWRGFIAALNQLPGFATAPTRDDYVHVRSGNPTDLLPDVDSVVASGAVLFYLNHYAFNGLYRLNKHGAFNVPPDPSRLKRPLCDMLDTANLRAVAEALQRPQVRIMRCGYDHAIARSRLEGPSPTIYVDPPYWPVSSTANFTAYTGTRFTDDDQRNLADWLACVAREANAEIVASNAWTPPVLNLYRQFELNEVAVRRNINRDGAKRGPVPEMIAYRRRRP